MGIILKPLRVATTMLVLGMLGSSVLAQGCKPLHTFKTVTPNTLTVATSVLPPFTLVNSSGMLTGVDGEILKIIAAKECLALAIVIADPSAIIQYVTTKKADMAAGNWYRTVSRAKIVDLTAPLYIDQMGIFSKDGAATVGSLQGKRVGSVLGYLWVADLQKLLGSGLSLYPNPVALAQDLATGRIDVGVDSYAAGISAQGKGGYAGIKISVAVPDARIQASVQSPQAGFPYTKANTALGAALDAHIKDLHQSGEIVKILTSYGLAPSAAEVGVPHLVP